MRETSEKSFPMSQSKMNTIDARSPKRKRRRAVRINFFPSSRLQRFALPSIYIYIHFIYTFPGDPSSLVAFICVGRSRAKERRRRKFWKSESGLGGRHSKSDDYEEDDARRRQYSQCAPFVLRGPAYSETFARNARDIVMLRSREKTSCS